jgi:hypothetical protein
MSLTIELRGGTWSAGRPRPAELFASFVVDGRDARRSIFNVGTDGARSPIFVRLWLALGSVFRLYGFV